MGRGEGEQAYGIKTRQLASGNILITAGFAVCGKEARTLSLTGGPAPAWWGR